MLRAAYGTARAFLLTLPMGLGACGAPCPELQYGDSESLLGTVGVQRPGLASLRAEASVEQFGDGGRVRGTVLMFVDRPDRLRFDVMTQFGPAAVLTSDGRQFALADLREARYATGPACADNVGRILGIPMGGDEAARFLLGAPPALSGRRSTLSCDDGCYQVEGFHDGELRDRMVFKVHEEDLEVPPEAQRLFLSSVTRFEAGRVAWEVEYDDYRVVTAEDGAPYQMPFRVRFVDDARNLDTTVKFRSMALNIDVPGEAFSQAPRAGMVQEFFPCQNEDVATQEARP